MSVAIVIKSRQCFTYIKIIWKIFHAISWEPFYSEILQKHSKTAFLQAQLGESGMFFYNKIILFIFHG